MEFSVEIAAYFIFGVVNIAAIFFVKSKFSSQIIVSLLALLLLGLIAFTVQENGVFLKISCGVAVFSVIINYFLSLNFFEDKYSLLTKKSSFALLMVVFIILSCLVVYLGSSAVDQNKNSNSQISSLIKDKSNYLSSKIVKVRKIRNVIKNDILIDNLGLIILFSTCLPLFLTNLSKDEHI